MSIKSRRAFLRNAAVAAPAVGAIWSQRRTCGIDPRVHHIVVLMLENRSFDHMLGFTFQGDPKVSGYPSDLTTLPPNLDPTTEKLVLPSPEAEYAGDFYPDPGHDFQDVQLQLFNTKTPAKDAEPNMRGFVRSYLEVWSESQNARADAPPKIQCRKIMRGYERTCVPVLSKLAQEYAVCDHWFCSVPAATLPNRKFVHAGTSRGQLDLSVAQFNVSPTIYEVLDGDNASSVIYAQGWTAAATFNNLIKYQDRFFGTLDDFYQDCAENRLPAYSFLEPRYASGLTDGVFRPQNDQHPDSDVQTGEELIFSVYRAIRTNPEVWNSTMLVIVYDEHGGLFDHVCPPRTVAPDSHHDDQFPDFGFDRLGPRVPAVIVSAYTGKGTVLHDVFDHTSIIATVRLLLTGKCNDPVLGFRAQSAKTFECALNLPPGHPRADIVRFDPFCVNRHLDIKKRRPNHLQLKWRDFAKHVNYKLPRSQRVHRPRHAANGPGYPAVPGERLRRS